MGQTDLQNLIHFFEANCSHITREFLSEEEVSKVPKYRVTDVGRIERSIVVAAASEQEAREKRIITPPLDILDINWDERQVELVEDPEVPEG